MDEYLIGYADKYDRWRTEGDFTISSRVIPVHQSLAAQQWILPAEQVMQVIRNAQSFALTDCVCRTHYARCNKPRDVCLLLDELSDKAVEHNKARRISIDQASEVLKRAGDHGLVHMTLFMPGHKIYALCSCCACCCHDLQLLLKYGRRDLVARSDYAAVTDQDLCNHCGTCVDRCVFGARTFNNGVMTYDAAACLGCGLCVSICPTKANAMQER
jgi:ferredoxin